MDTTNNKPKDTKPASGQQSPLEATSPTNAGSPNSDKSKKSISQRASNIISCCLSNASNTKLDKELRQRRVSVSAERYDPEDAGDYTKVVHPKTAEQRKRLNDAIKNIFHFRSLDGPQMEEILDAMFEKPVVKDEVIIEQGDDGDNFYVIDSGKFDIFVKKGGKREQVGNFNNEGFFGELALMYNMPRSASVVACDAGCVWGLDRQTFRRIVLMSAFTKRKKYEAFLESVTILKSLDLYERMNLCDALTSATYENGEKIIAQGAKAECMYFVEEGAVRVAMTKKGDKRQEEQEVGRVGVGGYFGELALVTHKPRAASVYAVGAVKCAVLEVGAFERLMGPCMNIMRRNIKDYETQLVQVFGGDKSQISDLR